MELVKTYKVGKSTVKVTIKTGKIDVRKHQFRDNPEGTYMDGIRAFGIAGVPDKNSKNNILLDYVDSFKIEWDGRQVPMNKNDVFHLFNVSLNLAPHSVERPSGTGSVLFVPAVKDDAFLLSVMGGTGAATFTAWWMVRKTGIVGFCVEGEP